MVKFQRFEEKKKGNQRLIWTPQWDCLTRKVTGLHDIRVWMLTEAKEPFFNFPAKTSPKVCGLEDPDAEFKWTREKGPAIAHTVSKVQKKNVTETQCQKICISLGRNCSMYEYYPESSVCRLSSKGTVRVMSSVFVRGVYKCIRHPSKKCE